MKRYRVRQSISNGWGILIQAVNDLRLRVREGVFIKEAEVSRYH